MKQFPLVFFFVFSLINISFAQDTLRVEGNYTGKNIYVQNPFDSAGKGFCTKKVLVNNTSVPFDSASAFEINLAAFNFAMGAKVKIEIIHSADCSPKILNTEMNCHPICQYSIFSIKIEKDSMLTWVSAEQNGKFIYVIEQFRWNKWVKCGEVESASGIDTTTYNFNIKKYVHSGENQFRVKVIDYSSTPLYSKVAKLTLEEIKPFMTSRCNGEITFAQNTSWEIYDNDGNLVSKGYGNSVSIARFKKGHYILNYDNTSMEFYGNNSKAKQK